MTFENLYNLYSKIVYNVALQYVQNIEDAEEITQDVFIIIHDKLSGFQQNSSLKTWIYRISVNKSLDFIKAKKTQKRFAFFTSLFTDEGEEVKTLNHHFNHPGIELEQKEALENIFKHINTLPENQKTVLILHKIENISIKEVAEIMELTYKAVESLLQRAKVNLTKKLNHNEGIDNSHRLNK